jgi:hypothetical protein
MSWLGPNGDLVDAGVTRKLFAFGVAALLLSAVVGFARLYWPKDEALNGQWKPPQPTKT